MNAAQLPFLVEGIIMLMAGIFGILIGKAGKPYGKVKVVFHLFFYAWLTMGFCFIFAGSLKAKTSILIPVIIIGLAVLTQLVTGIMMLASRKSVQTLPKIHIISAVLMILSDTYALIISGLR